MQRKASIAVAALSARQLAQSASRGGWRVYALDLFGDLDTRAAASQWYPIGAPQTLRFDGDRLLRALRDLDDADCQGWIAGAGFEGQPELLTEGARIFPLLGSDPATAACVRDPRAWFAALEPAGLACPETRFSEPEDPRGWLVKNAAGSGGRRIRRAERRPGAPVETGDYFQREVAGRPMSLLFAAARGRAFPIGINALLAGAVAGHPYAYRGAIGPVCATDSPLGRRLVRAAQSLAQTFALRGLASLDFLLDGDAILALELNARPTATLGLYDAHHPRGLVHVHVEACAGSLPAAPAPAPHGLRGEMVVYARTRAALDEVQVHALQALGCADVPLAGSRLAPGAPVCSVTAQAGDADAVFTELSRREASVLAVVQNRKEVPADAR